MLPWLIDSQPHCLESGQCNKTVLATVDRTHLEVLSSLWQAQLELQKDALEVWSYRQVGVN